MESKSKTKNGEPDEEKKDPPKRDQVSAAFGYILMSIAVLAFLVMMIKDELGHPSGYAYIEVPILFFITMLVFVCIHPDLLKDAGKNLSTMRVVVFMMVNVVCLLMLRIGWDSLSFNAIGMKC